MPILASEAIARAQRDAQTVTPQGEPITDERVDGVVVRRSRTITDDRGTICEILSESWGFTEEPIVHVYEATIRPGVVKGWIVHLESDDRLFFCRGSARVVLFDARDDSPTSGLVDVVYFDPANRGLIRIPRGVFHAVQNLGAEDAVFINLPTEAYRHEQPDKYRLPLDTELIPFRF